ncbi:Glycoside hydrolase family 47 [Dillenia turbinata]|uniref:alpha-1,2-Mannosidase n=1 Tax=Dillenia turbinata TaxID=194707 RepID=A0AAN8YY40_9MAGN
MLTSTERRKVIRCSTGKFLVLLMIGGLAYLMLTQGNHVPSVSNGVANGTSNKEGESTLLVSKWKESQESIKKAFIQAWSGYKNYAMGHDELMPLSRRGTDGLGVLGATIVDALDTAIIMGVDEVVLEAGSWIEAHLSEKISQQGQVNLFETTTRVLGGLLSAYHLSGGEQERNLMQKGPKPVVYLRTAKALADRLLSTFTSSTTSIPFGDVVLRNSSEHLARDGPSGTLEVSTLQLEFNNLSAVLGNPKYSREAMKVMEHIKTLPKVEGLVPIYTSPHSGEFNGENIRLGSDGDSYYEYLLKVWLQQGARQDGNLTYLHNMYQEAMKGVRHLLVRKFIPNGWFSWGNCLLDLGGAFSPKVDHPVECFLKRKTKITFTSFLLKSKFLTWMSSICLYRYCKWGWQIFEAFEKHTKVDSGGYTCLNDVTVIPPRKRDKMETFFLGETLKYLYLLFAERSVIPLDKCLQHRSSSNSS